MAEKAPDPKQKPDQAHTPQGAPTDRAHERAGDGTSQGAVPAGLTREQLKEIGRSEKTDNTGTG